jgi:exodeoxyribonuclease VII large subunit
MEIRILTVKELNKGIKKLIEGNSHMSNLNVKGEISNCTLHSSGHMYFSIKDEGSVIKAVMFNTQRLTLPFKPKEGMKIIANGDISVYEPSGQYQINVKGMKEDGIGDLHLKFEELKAKLEKEGLFSPIYKKEIPKFPKKIGVVTSPTGAAIQDIITTIQRRYPMAEIILAPTVVQGDQAPSSIIKAIQLINKHSNVDVLIIGRGGGSIEDLWCFNDENVARAIFDSTIPIISAVGHETDFTISDFVADIRAATPTGAAEIATPYSVQDLKEIIKQFEDKFKRELLNNLKYNTEKSERLIKTLQYFHPKKAIETQTQRLDILNENLKRNIKTIFEKNTNNFNKVSDQLQNIIQQQIDKKQQSFILKTLHLDSLSPLKIMSRGYSMVLKDNILINNINQLKQKDEIQIQVLNGIVDCTVRNIKEDNNHE